MDDGPSQPRRKSRLINAGRVIGWGVIGSVERTTSLPGDHHPFRLGGRSAKRSAGRWHGQLGPELLDPWSESDMTCILKVVFCYYYHHFPRSNSMGTASCIIPYRYLQYPGPVHFGCSDQKYPNTVPQSNIMRFMARVGSILEIHAIRRVECLQLGFWGVFPSIAPVRKGGAWSEIAGRKLSGERRTTDTRVWPLKRVMGPPTSFPCFSDKGVIPELAWLHCRPHFFLFFFFFFVLFSLVVLRGMPFSLLHKKGTCTTGPVG